MPELDPFHQHLLGAIQTESGDFDKFIGSAGLAVFAGSVGAATMLSPPFAAGSSIWLWISWALTASSLVAMAWSKLTSQKGLRRHFAREQEGVADLFERPAGAYGAITIWLNRVAMTSLVLGLASFLNFARLNLSHLEEPHGKAEKQLEHHGSPAIGTGAH